MSIFSALGTAVTGLRAQSFALEIISDNIANSQTQGYKRVDASFEDMVASVATGQQTGGTVAYGSRSTIGQAGTTLSTGVATNFSLSGPGFITVKRPSGLEGSDRVFQPGNAFTRRGDFSLDKDGYLVNGAGYYLVGNPLDPVSGTRTGAAPDVLRISAQFIPAKATGTIAYAANLPATPKTNAWDDTVPGSDLWAATPLAQVTTATTPSSSSLVDHSISGGSMRLYDSAGRSADVDVRWAKTGQTATGSTWAMYTNATTASPASNAEWTKALTATFDSSGRLVTPAQAVAVDLSARGLGTVSVDVSKDNLRQNDDQTGQVTLFGIKQDGYGAGTFTSLSIANDGRVDAQFTNGRTQPLAQIALAQFNAPDMMRRETGSAFTETVESGTPLFRSDGTAVSAGQVEGSNTDVAEEFSRMIVTQQAYSANTRVISAAQDMMQQLMQVIR